MAHLKICRICLRTETKMYTYDKFQLKYIYEEIMACKVNDNEGLPQTFCYECATMMHKSHKFKEKCFRGQRVLRELQWTGTLTYEAVYKVDRQSKNLLSPLSITTLSDKAKGFSIKDCLAVKQEHHNIDYESFFSHFSKDGHESNTKDKIKDGKFTDINVPYAIGVKKETKVLTPEEIQMKSKEDYSNERRKVKKRLNLNKWKVIKLSDEQALNEFRARAEEQKYLTSPFKCTDCFKGFSKKAMLDRHFKLRHYEGIGKFSCEFCRMRYKWNCDLRKHMLHHYQKFECQQCELVCMQENSAILHEDFHNGKLKECVHCDLKFKHLSTYYTHLRTHRSDHLCTLCGASFVSDMGLQQHKRLMHVGDIVVDSPDDDEEVNTFCERCNMWFDTRQAFEEHAFHSATHVTSEQTSPVNEVVATRKVLSKLKRAKITNTQRTKRKSDGQKGEKRRKKINKRMHRKPTTCYQCGKFFDTQAACLKHHHSEHPRTPFQPPTDRYICEICGASLAPGSVAVHLNIHTRETTHTCDTCGRTFHSSVGLKRHLVTHTGEKRFTCTKCNKRFTQSNSMKLHYKTLHLKQPYPKRSKRKKDTPQDSTRIEPMTIDKQPNRPPPEPTLPEPPPGIEPVPNALPMPDENVQYMRL